MTGDLQFVEGRWLRQRPLAAKERKSGVVIQDCTAEVQLAALQKFVALLAPSPRPQSAPPVSAAIVDALLTASTEADARATLGIERGEMLVAMLRLIS